MENITHSLVGATLAELALPQAATPAQRRLFFTAGIVAANLPDADLLYTRITAAPLGYLLHHRGHTHTIVGLAVQALIVGLVCALPAIRNRLHGVRNRFALLIGIALSSHLLLDSWNSYGIHPFWPLDNRWFYGDSIYIIEPWLWLLLGVTLALNAQAKRTRIIVGALLALLALPALALVSLGMIGVPVFAALAIGAAIAVAVLAKVAPRTRSIGTLIASSAFVIAMFGARHVVEQHARETLAHAPSARVIDIVLSPELANPFCWNALAIVKDDVAGEFVMTRGSVPLGTVARCGGSSRGQVVWSEPVRQTLESVRRLVRADCRVRAWMQFGRAPVVGAGEIADMRFGGLQGGNFSAMPLAAPASACPEHLTAWTMPRADLLQ